MLAHGMTAKPQHVQGRPNLVRMQVKSCSAAVRPSRYGAASADGLGSLRFFAHSLARSPRRTDRVIRLTHAECHARVAELADAQASGACVLRDVGVQVPPRAHSKNELAAPPFGGAAVVLPTSIDAVLYPRHEPPRPIVNSL